GGGEGPGGTMSEGLGPQARALLEAARGGMAPDSEAVRRMRARLDVAMTAAAVRPPANALSLAAKLAGVTLAVVAAGAIAYVRHGSAPVAPVAAPAAAPAPLV